MLGLLQAMTALQGIVQGQLSMPKERQSFYVDFADTALTAQLHGMRTKKKIRISRTAHHIVSPWFSLFVVANWSQSAGRLRAILSSPKFRNIRDRRNCGVVFVTNNTNA